MPECRRTHKSRGSVGPAEAAHRTLIHVLVIDNNGLPRQGKTPHDATPWRSDPEDSAFRGEDHPTGAPYPRLLLFDFACGHRGPGG